MLKPKLFFFSVILSMLLAWTFGCSSTATEQGSPAQEPTEEIALEPTLPPPSTPTSEPAITNHCLDCHTDKDRLISTAKPEEEAISENKGEG